MIPQADPTKAPSCFSIAVAALVGLLLLAGCSDGGMPVEPGSPPGGDEEEEVISGITVDNARALTRASLDMISKLVIIGNISNTLLRQHIDLLSGPQRLGRDIVQCGGGYDNETNRIDYREIAPGYWMPAGPSLHAGLLECAIEGITVSGFIDITAIVYESEGGFGDWSAEAEIFLNPIGVINGNGTQASLTDHMSYKATMVDGVLTTTLEIAADPGAGIIGGLNAQHYALPVSADTDYVNYQFRPFRIRTVDDPGTGYYTVAVEPHEAGSSALARYTNDPDAEINMRIETTPVLPILWQGGRPTRYDELPASGEIRFTESCSGCGSILASVGDGVILTVSTSSGVVAENVPWAALLAPPGAP